MEIVGVIPAAGRGERLKPYPVEKEMFPIGFHEGKPKPVSQYLLERMLFSGIRKVFVIVNSDKINLIKYYKSGKWLGLHIAYIYQDEPLGMGNALCHVLPWISNDSIIVMGMPDTIFEPFDAFSRLIDFFMTSNCDLALGLFRVSEPNKYGMVRIDEMQNIVCHVDKPLFSDLEWCWGIACWGRRFSSLINEICAQNGSIDREFKFGDLIDIALQRRFAVKGIKFEDGRYLDIGTSSGILQAILYYGNI